MTDTTPAEPVCKFEEGCHRVVACEPGCAAATVPAPAPTDQAALRDRIAEALRPGSLDRGGQYPEGLLRDVDAVLAVLLGPIPPDTDIPTWTAIRAIQLMNEAGRETEAQRLALSQALGLGTGAPWDAIRDRAAELAALPEPANRAAIRAAALREAADFVGNDDDCDCGGCDTCLPRKLAAELRRMADAASGPGGVAGETQQDETQAQPPRHRWAVETRDGLADEWAPGTRFLNRHHAVERYEALAKSHPTWRDGTPVERRLVRETVTYTVEQPAAVSQPDGEA
jgi:hypothetical protein